MEFIGLTPARIRALDRATLQEATGWLADVLTGASDTGVSANNAWRIGSVLACITLRANVLASLPADVFERQANDGRRVASWMNAYKLLTRRPNPRMTPSVFKRTLWINRDAHGNGYAEIQWQRPGDSTTLPVGLWPLPARMVTPRRTPPERYHLNPSGMDYHIPSLNLMLRGDSVIHIKGLSFDGVEGLSPVTVARRTFGFAGNTEAYGESFYANGGLPSGVLEYPKKLADVERKRIRESWTAGYGTLSQAQRVALLEDGMKFSPITVSPEDAQFLEARRLSSAQIAALYHVPARLVEAHQGSVGWGSVEQQFLEWVQTSLQPDVVELEEELNAKLLWGLESYFCKFNLDGMQRADFKTRNEGLAIRHEHGVITANEWRALEDMPPIEGGDRAYMPLNTCPVNLIDDAVRARITQAEPAGPVSQRR